MAIITKGNGFRTAAQTYASGQGTIKLQFADRDYFMNLDKAQFNEPFTIPAATGDFEGHEFIGASFGVTGTANTGNAHLFAEGFSNPVANTGYTITEGIGKVKILRVVSGVSIEKTVDISEIIGVVIDGSSLELQQGSVLFARVNGTATTPVTSMDPYTAPAAGRVIHGGSGVATITQEAANITQTETDLASVDAGESEDYSVNVGQLVDSVVSVTAAGLVISNISVNGQVVSFTATNSTASNLADVDVVIVFNGDNGDINVKLRLNQISYPFTLAQGETISPIGSSMVFRA